MNSFNATSPLPGSYRDTFRAAIKDGAVAAWPICMGYAPIGVAFGVLAQKAGLSPLEIGLMSLLVFAGSSQFIAVSMLSGGAAATPIILTTFIVNLRHLLMSSSLAVHLGRLNMARLSLYAYGITDESFALNTVRFRDGGWDWRRALILNHVSNLAWIISSIVGGYGGRFIPAGAFGIDYALPAMFICLLVMQLRGGLYIVVAIISALIALACSLLIAGNAYIIIASMAAATLGVLLKRRAGRAEKSSEAS